MPANTSPRCGAIQVDASNNCPGPNEIGRKMAAVTSATLPRVIGSGTPQQARLRRRVTTLARTHRVRACVPGIWGSSVSKMLASRKKSRKCCQVAPASAAIWLTPVNMALALTDIEVVLGCRGRPALRPRALCATALVARLQGRQGSERSWSLELDGLQTGSKRRAHSASQPRTGWIAR